MQPVRIVKNGSPLFNSLEYTHFLHLIAVTSQPFSLSVNKIRKELTWAKGLRNHPE